MIRHRAHTVHVPDSGKPLKLRIDINFSEVAGSMPHYLDVTITDSSTRSCRNYFNSATVVQAAVYDLSSLAEQSRQQRTDNKVEYKNFYEKL